MTTERRNDSESRDVTSIVVISAGISDPSTTRMLADRIGVQVRDLLIAGTDPAEEADQPHAQATVRVVELRDMAQDIAAAATGAVKSDRLQEALDRVAAADGVIAVTPVFKASYTGLFKSFLDVLDDDALLAMPVLLAATAGTPRHALVPDEAMRPVFSYLRALPVPTSVFAATEDWSDPRGLTTRIKRASTELAALIQSGVRGSILDVQGGSYKRTFGGGEADDSLDDLDFDTDLMRLATGGSAGV